MLASFGKVDEYKNWGKSSALSPSEHVAKKNRDQKTIVIWLVDYDVEGQSASVVHEIDPSAQAAPNRHCSGLLELSSELKTFQIRSV